ncbi:galactose mutarotase-like domain-containing protein [Gilbertella persicaria]|uniref:galactose mutarotase-like domain-containing protein n=1 Tax=Gilbertella persicaria TaxID=101096 RepID=UPI00222039BA|nr:galactose mutarotase-like domain-containing protein [Gilbertella persicaria]KAI8098364.1 galactose mutarotase-like domain-containing protein [Gilbertella persicaria]
MDLLSQFQFSHPSLLRSNTLLNPEQAPQVLEHPKLIRSITIDRCSNFISAGANGNDLNLLSQLYRARTNSEEYISLLVYSVPDLKRISFQEAIQQEFRPTRLGEWFGPSWSTHWFHVQIRIPNEFVGEEVLFIWNADNEAMIWSMEGVTLQGLTGGAGNDARHEYILTTHAEGGEIIQFYIEMACNGMFGAGNGLIGPPDPNRFFNLNAVDLAVPNKIAWDLLYDFQIILGMAKDLPEDSLRGSQALYTANRIINQFIPGDDDSITQGLEIAQSFLGSKNGDAQHEIIAVGHCHIDTAWLWPFDETIRKSARSWSSQINLMDRYPDYKFICSQAQQFEWVKERYLPLWERILEKVTLGQFLPTGGTWVEMDTNMPSGESLCRQFLLGQRFFEQNFGRRCKVFWLPDSFGYSSQLPQLMLLADMNYFFTQKLSWNNVNKFPLTTFWWIGLDGSKALTHMAPSETYNAQCTPEELVRSVKNHRDKVYSNTSLLVYGNGDGGGGPLASMIERLRRMKNVDGLPKTEMVLPSWKGELYFELHRGIYTTQSFCKKLNRTCEFLLRDIEMLATFAMMAWPDTFQYPATELEEFWKLICLPQFHDVMSGSAIELVYEDCLQMYTKVDVLGKQMRHDLMTTLLGLKEGEEEEEEEVSTGSTSLAVINTLPWERHAILEVEDNHGLSGMKQYSAFGRTGYAIATGITASGVTCLTLEESLVGYEPVKVQTDRQNNVVMENQWIKVTFDQSGHLVHLFDKRVERELIKENERGNVFRMYEDIPLFWDAWDVEIYHLEKYQTIEAGSVQILEQGPLRASVLIEKKISKTSRLRQIVVLTAVSRRLDFETEVDWNENRQFLKVEFAWDIMTDHVNYECQYGHVQRPTHDNTSWEAAKFEVVAQKFADMSEYGYGVALLNDCKYGYSAHRNVLRLSLLRSPKAPDSNCDVGHHSFKYAIYPHEQHFLQSDVVREGYNFNSPLLTRIIPRAKMTDINDCMPHFRIENAPNVVLDTIKKAEDSNDIIIRLYEAYGGHARARLMSSTVVKKAIKCNILEDPLEDIPIHHSSTLNRTFSTNLRVLDDDVLELQQQEQERQKNEGLLIKIKPFEVVTLKLIY